MPSVMINHRVAVNGLRIRKSNSWYASLLISYLIYKNRINILLVRMDNARSTVEEARSVYQTLR